MLHLFHLEIDAFLHFEFFSIYVFSRAEIHIAESLFEADVAGDVIGVDAVDVLLELGCHGTVLFAEIFGKLEIAVPLGLEDEVGPVVNGLFSFLEVDGVDAVFSSGEGALFLHHIVAHHVGFTVRAGGTEPYGTEQAGDESGDGIFFGDVGDLFLVNEVADDEEPEDVGFRLFPRGLFGFEGFIDGAFLVDGLLDAEAVSHFVEGDVPEEGIEFEMVHLFGVEDDFADGDHDFVELGLHAVAELEPACALLGLHAVVVGQVDGDGLAAGVAVACVIDGVIDIQV